ICALADFAGEILVPSFYEALSVSGPINRDDLDWETGDLYGNWMALRPLLETWALAHLDLDTWQSKIVRSLIDYETHRLHFVSGGAVAAGDALAFGENWAAFPTNVDLIRSLERICSNQKFDPSLLVYNVVVLVRKPPASFGAYVVEPSLLPRLIDHDDEIMKI